MKKVQLLYVMMLINPLIIMSQQIDFYPEQKPEVSNADYRYGTNILSETYLKVKRDNGTFNYADYWNVGVAYIVLKQDSETVREMIAKSRELGTTHFAEMFLYANAVKEANRWKQFLSKEEYDFYLKDAYELLNKEKETQLKIKKEDEICVDERYDEGLVALFKILNEKDRKFRFIKNINIEKQHVLDVQNLKIIDSLAAIHKKYIGASYVGEKYKHVMWSIIQHSNLETMEKYLPLIHEATKEKELEFDMLKMLLDRIYTLDCGYQIYGSQGGIPLGPIDEIEAVKKEYAENE